MSNKINDLLKRIKDKGRLELPKVTVIEATEGSKILQSLSELKQMLTTLMLEKQLSDLTHKVEQLTNTSIQSDIAPEKKDNIKKPSNTELLENLKEIATTRNNPNNKNETQILLHRLTVDFEYQKSANEKTFTTTSSTEWGPDFGVADLKQDRSETLLKGACPVVSCWIDESAITGLAGAQDNTGTWNNLGQNPHKNNYKVLVKPGKYEIYSELRQ